MEILRINKTKNLMFCKVKINLMDACKIADSIMLGKIEHTLQWCSLVKSKSRKRVKQPANARVAQKIKEFSWID